MSSLDHHRSVFIINYSESYSSLATAGNTSGQSLQFGLLDKLLSPLEHPLSLLKLAKHYLFIEIHDLFVALFRADWRQILFPSCINYMLLLLILSRLLFLLLNRGHADRCLRRFDYGLSLSGAMPDDTQDATTSQRRRLHDDILHAFETAPRTL